MTDDQKNPIPLWLFAMIGLVIAAGIVLSVEFFREDPSEEAGLKRAVRSHLDRTLDDPSFQEIEWGPVESHRLGKTISLRYRARNRFNAWELRNDLFLVTITGAVRIIESPAEEVPARTHRPESGHPPASAGSGPGS